MVASGLELELVKACRLRGQLSLEGMLTYTKEVLHHGDAVGALNNVAGMSIEATKSSGHGGTG